MEDDGDLRDGGKGEEREREERRACRLHVSVRCVSVSVSSSLPSIFVLSFEHETKNNGRDISHN